MTILPTVTTLKGFRECIKSASPVASGRFSIPGKGEFSYDQLADKFAELITETPLPGDRALARNIFTHLKNLAGSPDCMESIRKKLVYTEEEASPRQDRLFTAMLPKFFEESPSAAAKLILSDRDARAVAMELKSGDTNMFALAERIGEWEERSGIDFDKSFTIEEHEKNCPAIFEKRLDHWIKTGGTADNLSDRETAAERIRTAYNGGQPGENTVLDLRDLQLSTIPSVIDAIPNLQRLKIENGVVLQNPRVVQYLPRCVVLDLIKADHTHFKHVRRDLIDDEFIFDALSRNGAVLQHLRREVKCDMLFLLEAVNRAPGILAYVPEAIKSDRDFMLSLVNAFAFGKDKWEKYYGAAVEDAPPLPDDVVDILCSNDPYDTGVPSKKVSEMFDLVYRPKAVNGESLNLITFEELAKSPKSVNPIGYNYFSSRVKEKHGAVSPTSDEWLLIRKDIIPGSRNQLNEAQRTLVVNKGYEVPDLLSAALGILTHYARTGEFLFADDPWTLTICKETVNKHPTVVGRFAPAGLSLRSLPYVHADAGVGALQKFS